jgi:putative ATP-binding cassette transporter
MAKTAAKHRSASKKAAKTAANPEPIVEVLAEDGDHVAPPPPEVVEPDPQLSPEEAEQARKNYLLTRFWISARGFWGRHGDKMAWPFTIGLLLLIVGTLGFQYGINVWNRAIFDAIEKRESASVFHLTAIFFPLAVGSVVFGVAQVFARMGIQRRWRGWLTHSVVTRWLTNGRYYQLNLVGGDHQNPEYRIAEDLRIATDSPVDFIAGVTSALLSAATFIVVLWTIGGALTVSVAGSTLTIPGFLVIAAVVYAAIASGSIMVIGRRFVQNSEDKNQAEAEFRYTLTRARKRREHRPARRRAGRARWHRQDFRQRAAAVGAARGSAHADHTRVAGIEPDRARHPPAAVRAQIPRRQHEPRSGDAGG